jgi:hypothetical protein
MKINMKTPGARSSADGLLIRPSDCYNGRPEWAVLYQIAFSREGRKEVYKFSLLETVTGNFNSLISRKSSLFFLSLDGSLPLAKRS